MLPVSMLSLGVLALSAQFLSPVTSQSGDAHQIYTEWKQSSNYSQAVQVVNTVGGTAAGSFTSATSSAKNGVSSSDSDSSAVGVSVGSLESNETITFPPSTDSAGSSATITASSSSGSSTVVTTITETEEQQRFDQALTVITELQWLHPHANFSINTPFVLLTSDEFLAYVNRYAIDPASNPVKAGSTATSSAAGMFTSDAENSSSTVTSSASGNIRTSSAASGGSLPNLSDQQLISCDGEDGNSGCGGGYAAYTMDWVANERSGKMCTLDSYPFASDDGNVPSCSMSSCTEFDVGVAGYDSVREDPGAIEDAVRKQPVSIFLYSGSTAFQYYSSGVLTGENCDKTGSHSALAVGFGETDDNVLYWRIKNQWGTAWGEDGYVRVQRRYSGDSDGACGVEMYATWPTFDVSATGSSTSDSATSAPSVTTASPSATTSAPSVTTSAPSVTTSAPSVTTSAPSVTSAPSATTATPTSTPSSTSAASTAVPLATKATAVTDTPSATETVQNTVDQSVPVASSSSGSDSTIQNETVDQVSATSGSTRLYEAVTPEPDSVDDAANSLTTTPSTTEPSTTQSASVAGDASYASTPSMDKRDCAM
ncbi:hypothetical protein PF005_g493 [Phytophthora fragariae]|uniref:Peptidase C1A papain C-terminal domain-containing protein n=2 Tax=Phytophthora fragariae TaxID=53985 RepID=A0A6A3ZQ26_9STRA|nr:hypothetical protein PF009_g498 [Phytophthora fragariae]KAE9139748.1 hypothetical protein PF010_g450 [Phytophthora fragariae]KAE9155716.1 hypothetical protein PF006_g332 [Phytophthora fragariae]KAE9237789.1 hypothetical protein PF005_g493 [Phytophthora fragariae]